MALFLLSSYLVISSVYLLLSGGSLLVEFVFGNLGGSSLSVSLFFDWVSLLFSGYVLLITSSILVYSVGYMQGERRSGVFLMLLLLFVASMLCVVFSLNLISIMLGWDGLGLSSYLLVVYYNNHKSSAAGMITALSNRVGDAAIMVGLALMMEAGNWDFMGGLLFSSLESLPFILGFIVLAAITKSAQIPFSAWLPEAMAAPTPVSALVHSSTLVTAGVYLLIRFHPLIIKNGLVVKFLLGLGMITMLMAGINGSFEMDMKKVVALSTLSQLGVMFVSLGLGLTLISFFHLLTHATFKALLFMCSGEVIHESLGGQDMRRMGGLSRSLPFTSLVMGTTNMALCGVPFLAGFYSKDMVVELGFMPSFHIWLMLLLGVGVGLSSVYSVRMVMMSLVLFSGCSPMHSSSEGGNYMYMSKFLLWGLSLGGGCILSWLIFPDPPMVSLPLVSKILALVFTIVGGFLGFYISHLKAGSLKMGGLVSWCSSKMWFLSCFSSKVSMILGSGLGSTYSYVDTGWTEGVLGKGVYYEMSGASFSTSNTPWGSVSTYMKVFLLLVVYAVLGE
uniref:NADH-ubiquinone oxidoreductase chain 5 n=1 Tax=Orthione mesoamericana TaxID=2480053 RepID=A0A8K1Y3J1_9CRUS|nr:NADH dehydrogenase subunit 5 [Orthione mesoamericana]